jgi:hypothetical protein
MESVFLDHLTHSLVIILTELFWDLKKSNNQKNSLGPFSLPHQMYWKSLLIKYIWNWEITCVGSKGAGCQSCFWFVSLFQLGDLSNPELRILTDQLDKIRHGGEYDEHFSLFEFNFFVNLDLLPDHCSQVLVHCSDVNSVTYVVLSVNRIWVVNKCLKIRLFLLLFLLLPLLIVYVIFVSDKLWYHACVQFLRILHSAKGLAKVWKKSLFLI